MGLFGWLFGSKSSPPAHESQEQPTWQFSENSNPTMVFAGGGRLTVFESDRGWKYCVSRKDDDPDPYFSEPYQTVEAAKYEALAHVTGAPSRHTSIRETYRQEGRDRWEAMVDEKVGILNEMKKALDDPELNLTQLRKIEAKAATQIRQLGWQVDELRRRGVNERSISLAEKLSQDFPELATAITERIAERKKRPSGK